MKWFKHLKTIIHHRNLVMVNCFKLGLVWQGLTHDLSKFSPTEFLEGAKYFQGFQSPNEKAREENGYSKAWLHHKGRNKHHFEYWYDINPASHKYEPVPMPTRYLKEMFCDRIAASKTYLKEKYTNKDPLDYFISHGARDKMHPATAKMLETFLTILAEKGDKEAFIYIKTNYKNDFEYWK